VIPVVVGSNPIGRPIQVIALRPVLTLIPIVRIECVGLRNPKKGAPLSRPGSGGHCNFTHTKKKGAPLSRRGSRDNCNFTRQR